MTIEEKVFSVLSADAGVLAVTTAAQIKPPGNWQALARPYIVHFPVALETTNTHDKGIVNLKIWRSYQVSCFGDTYSSARALAAAVKAALGSYRQDNIISTWTGSRTMPYSSDPPMNHIAVEFEIADSL